MHRLVEIYKQNMKLEEESRIIGNKGKTLINRCKEALKIIKKEFPDDDFSADKLKNHIQEMEDHFANHGYINAVDYNLDARIDIHMVIRNNNLFGKKNGWLLCHKKGKSEYHYLEDDKPICGITEYKRTEGEPSWNLMLDWACKKCLQELFKLRIQGILKDEPRVPRNFSSSLMGYGIDVERNKGWFKLVNNEYDVESDKRKQKIILKEKDPGYGKMTQKEYKKRFENLG